jgi:hypothetical protein
MWSVTCQKIGRKRSQYPIYATTLRHNRPPPRGVAPVEGQHFRPPRAAGSGEEGGAQAPGAGEPPLGSPPRGPARRPHGLTPGTPGAFLPSVMREGWQGPGSVPLGRRTGAPTDLGRPMHTALGVVALTEARWGFEPRPGVVTRQIDPRERLPSSKELTTGLCPVAGRLRRRRPHLGKRGRLGGAIFVAPGSRGREVAFPPQLPHSDPSPGGVGWVGSLRAGRVANTPRPVQSDCVGSTLSSLAPFRSPATQPKCGAGRGSCSS